MNQPPSRYSKAGLALHWLTAIIVLVAFIYGPGGSEARVYAPRRDFDRQLHETLGLLVLLMAVVRVIWRSRAVVPTAPASARWMHISAKAVQHGLYALLFIVPLTAIVGAWLEAHPLTLLAGVQIGPLLGESHALGSQIAELHGWLGDVILWIAGVHAVAALYHHFILKDRVLASMVPRWLIRKGPTEM